MILGTRRDMERACMRERLLVWVLLRGGGGRVAGALALVLLSTRGLPATVTALVPGSETKGELATSPLSPRGQQI